jgi:PAS domain S-box-containing protein
MKRKKDDSPAPHVKGLRPQAKQHVPKPMADGDSMPQADAGALVHELQVHQIALEMQHEELLRSQTAAQELQQKYCDLFDFAPSGYVVWDDRGEILDINLTAAALLGHERSTLIGTPFERFVAPADQPALRDFCRRVLSNDVKQGCELTLLAKTQSVWVHLEGVAAQDDEGKRVVCRTSISDIAARVETQAPSQEARHKTAAILESITDGFLSFDRQWRCTYANEAAARFLRVSRETLLSTPPAELFAAGAELRFRTEFSRAMDQRVPVHFEEFYPDLSAWFDCHVYPSPEGLSVYFRDITARKQLAESLRQSEERLQLAIGATNDAVWDCNLLDGTMTWNKTYLASFGSPPENIDPWQWWSGRIHPDDRDRTAASFHQALQGSQRTWTAEYRFLRVDGSWADVDDRACFARDGSGKAWRVVGAMLDVTHRKQSEAILRRTVQRLELLSEITADLLASKNPQAIVEPLCRKVMEHLECQVFFKYLLDEPQQRLRLSAHAGIPAKTAKQMEWRSLGEGISGDVAQNGCPIVADDIQARHDPRTDLVRSLGVRAFACHPLLSDGRVIGSLCFGSRSKAGFSDDELTLMKTVSDQVTIALQRTRLLESLERRVAERTAVAEQRAKQLRALAAELVQTEQRERRQLAQVLHDHLQQLLVSARMKTSRLRRRLVDEELTRFADEIDQLIDDSLTASRSLTVELSPPILYEAGLRGGLEWLSREMNDKHAIDIEVQADPAAEPTDEASRLFLFQATRELLFNVAKHARAERAQVRLAKTDNQEILIEVRDQGVGMRPEGLEAGIGTTHGFGLFSVRERLTLLGGRTEIESAPGQGTRIAIILPCAPAPPAVPDRPPPVLQADAPHELAPARQKRRSSRAKSQQLRILLADDHPIVRKGMVDLLRDRPEFEVVGEASNGYKAVELARQTHPDVILMDVTMPGLSGVEATRRITAELPGVRVIGLSMHEGDDMARAMREAGAVAYIRKGQDADTLVATIVAAAACQAPLVLNGKP